MSQPSSPVSPISAYYHTHWDREWYLPFRAYQVRLASVVDEILERLENDVLPCFMLDGQTVVLEDYLELRPENRERLKKLVEAGRLSIGPWFVMPDEFLVSGESLIRNMARGIQESKAWGCHQFTGYLPDTFGHSADMPTLLQNFGLDSAVIWRGVNPKQSLFLWQSPSGASVKSLHLTDGYFQMMLHDWTANPSQKKAALVALTQKLQAACHTANPVLLPIGGDHLAPVSAEGYALLKAQYPNLQETTPDQYLKDVPTEQCIETFTGELIENSGSFLLPGVYSARMYLKQANRQLEHLLTHKIEPLLALAQSLNLPKPLRYPTHELDLAWKTLLLNHPHDSICGCSVDAVHRENEVRFEHVTQLGEAIQHRTLAALSQQWAPPQEWIVFNTGETDYTGAVPAWEDVDEPAQPSQLLQVQTEQQVLQDEYLHDGHRIPLSHLTRTRRTGWIWAQDVPAFGVQTIAKSGPKTPPAFQPVQVGQDYIRNGLLSVQVEPDGALSVTDLCSGQTYAQLLQFHAQPDQGDSYNSAPVPQAQPYRVAFIGSRVHLTGPLVGSLTLTHQLSELEMTLVTEIRLQADCSLLSFETTFTNQTKDYKLQVGFSTGQPITTVTAESHLGLVTRHYDPHYREVEHMPVEKMKELRTNTGPVQRFFSANGQSWITQGLAEYEIAGERLSITLLRAFGYLSKGDTGVRGAQAGPPFATPEGQCLGRVFHCHYAWLPTPPAPQTLYHQAARFYGNVWGQSGQGEAVSKFAHPQAGHSLLQWEPPVEVVVSACYWAPGKGLVVRLLNPQSHPVTARLTPGFSYQALHEINFLEEPLQALASPWLNFGPHDVKTVLFAV
jgi:mannosylglycerate hydrolase